MKRTVQYPEARRFVARVSVKDSFWLCTNENLRSLSHIAAALEKVDDDVFRYHVTREKNDFEVWIREIVRDKELAREISRVKTKDTLIRKINERIQYVKKIVDRHKALRKKTLKKSKRMRKLLRRKLKRITKKSAKKKLKSSRKASRRAKRTKTKVKSKKSSRRSRR